MHDDPSCVKDINLLLEFLRRVNHPMVEIVEKASSPRDFRGYDSFMHWLRLHKLDGIYEQTN